MFFFIAFMFAESLPLVQFYPKVPPRVGLGHVVSLYDDIVSSFDSLFVLEVYIFALVFIFYFRNQVVRDKMSYGCALVSSKVCRSPCRWRNWLFYNYSVAAYRVDVLQKWPKELIPGERRQPLPSVLKLSVCLFLVRLNESDHGVVYSNLTHFV